MTRQVKNEREKEREREKEKENNVFISISDKEDWSKVPLIIIRLCKTARKSNVFTIKK